MFKLQRLEISGFKSFADYTEIVFTGDGITAVVGPNGCGKSNVSDSIAWVLGEQRAKSLRGEDMKDVIFQGTSKRQPAGMAEVVLHLVRADTEFHEDAELSEIDEALSDIDEHTVDVSALEATNGQNDPALPASGTEAETSDLLQAETESVQAMQVGSAQIIETKVKTKRHWRPRHFALDFVPGEAVSVSRRLYRSGESDYLLNGKSCRLRDIQDLFSGTGLSGAHYALIEQGRIGQILSAKPQDRRTLIEEAAGISKFRTRQRAAEARLESAKNNLRRISDIVDEIDKQVNSLRRQASKTRRYKILKDELRELLRQTFSAEGEYLTKLVDELKSGLDAAAKRERSLYDAVAESEDTFRAATLSAREAEESLSVVRQRQAENALARDRAERELHYREEQIGSISKRDETLRSEIRDAESRLKLISEEIERLAQAEKAQSGEAAKEELELRAAEQAYQEKIGAARELEARIESHRSNLMSHAAAVERLGEIRRQLTHSLERLAEREAGLEREGERAEAAYREHLKTGEDLEKQNRALNEKAAKLRGEKEILATSSSTARAVLISADKAFADKREELFRTRNRLETLQDLEASKAFYAPSVQKLFSEEKTIGVKFLGTLADRINVENQYEKAVEGVFGSNLQAILVGSIEEARKAADYVHSNKLGRTSLLVIDIDDAPGAGKDKLRRASRAAEPVLLDYMGAAADIRELLARVFPRETSAVVGLNEPETDKRREGITVTAAGEVFIAGRLLAAGKAGDKSLLSFKRELRELATENTKLAEVAEIAQAEAANARNVLEGLENQLVDLQSFIVATEREILAQEIHIKTNSQEIERAERHRKVIANERGQIKIELSDLRTRQFDAESSAGAAEAAKSEVSAAMTEIAGQLSEARAAAEQENSTLNEKRTMAGIAAERRRSAAASLRRVQTEEKELDAKILRLRFELATNESSLGELTGTVGEIEERIAAAGREVALETEELGAAAEKLRTARVFADEAGDRVAELNRVAAGARNARAELEVRQAESITRLQNLNDICAHELDVSLPVLVETVEVPADFDLEAARGQTDELRRRIEGFGAINMLALEELGESEERLLFLTSQRQDIVDGIGAAEDALREIKHRSRERFKTAFDAINEYFREFFLELFGGGRGEMTLLDADDVLESGIDVVAQPPGKRLQNILLLSGGEKAMTAIALVMAIFKYRPSPFCLLDEVDAPLDDANVGRFVKKIAEMSEKTQFIVITHNKRTMEAARALYGVTMQEPGVSKVVSVRFE
jgi:chromosome segregation protein